MKLRSRLILSIGFGTLIALIGLLGFGAIRRAQTLHSQAISAQESYLETDAVLRDIPDELYLGGILIRDYLLDPSHIMAPAFREQMLALRSSIDRRLDRLNQRLGLREMERLREFRTELQAYWDSMDPILSWSPREKAALSRMFLQNQVLPRREAVIALARDISEINAAGLREDQQRLQARHDSFQTFLSRTVFLALALGLVVAGISIERVNALEQRGDEQRRRAEDAEEELRRLSRKLVRTQEEERKALSRELHDAVGQMLSAMTMEIGNLESHIHSPEKLRERLKEARSLNAETLRAIRELAMGLRPTMLDELGLAPALRWQARTHSQRSGVPVSVQIDGDLEGLPESHRTSIYRIVQEALTNCARHAQATSIQIAINGLPGHVRLSIRDDGVGFEPRAAAARGLGLVGIQERVRELEGHVSISSQPRKGTVLEVEVPFTNGLRDDPDSDRG